MIQELESWLFLVSANRYLDYRTIVAPDFICDRRATSLLARNAGGDLVEHKVVYVSNDKVGELTLVFRVMDAIAEDLNVKGQGVLKDAFGREIYLAEGLVFKGRIPEIDLTQEQFREIHDQVKSYYRECWEWITPQPAMASESKIINLDTSQLIEISESSDRNQLQKNNQLYINTDSLTSEKSLFGSSRKLKKNLKSQITSIAFVPGTENIVIRYEKNQAVAILNLQLKSIYTWQGSDLKFGGCPTPARVSFDGIYVATARIEGHDQNFIKIFNLSSREEVASFEGSLSTSGRINLVEFGASNQKLLAVMKKKVVFFDFKDKNLLEIGKVYNDNAEIKSLSISPDNKMFATGDGKGKISIWEITTLSAGNVGTLDAHGTPNEAPVNSIVFSPDGKLLASAGDDYKVKLWDPYRKEEIATIGQHSTPVTIVAFSPDGNLLASGDDKGCITLWRISDRKSISVLQEHKRAVTSLAFSPVNPDGTVLVSGSKDKTVIVWGLMKSQ
jgi:WD40 repeat protein